MQRTEEERLEYNKYMREFYASHKEEIDTRNKKWAVENKEKKAACDKAYREKNKEELKIKQAQWLEENKEKYKAKKREYYLKHREEIRLKQKEYQEEYNQRPETIELHKKHYAAMLKRREQPGEKAKHRLRKRAEAANRKIGLATLTVGIIQQVYEENIQKFGTLTCELCFKPVKFGEDSLDHFHPISCKDTYPNDINERKNLGVAHGVSSVERCNMKKQGTTLQEWFDKHPESSDYIKEF